MSYRNGCRVALLVALNVALWCSGCGEEDNFATTTAVFGTVVDGTGSGLLGIHVGIAYEVLSVPVAAKPEVRPQAEPPLVRLEPPYPNPASQAVPAVSIPVTVSVAGDTTLSLEVRANFGGVSGHVVLVFEGTVDGDTTFVWDLEDGFAEPVPNGAYELRLTVPANPRQGAAAAVTKETVLVNTSITDMPFTGISNAVTDGNGEYMIDDIPVEERLIWTDENGQYFGEALVGNRIAMLFWDPAVPTQTVLREETIFKGETIEKVTQFSAVPAAAVAPSHRTP